MKTLKQFLLPVLESFEFGWQVIRFGKIRSWKGMEAPYGERCWIT